MHFAAVGTLIGIGVQTVALVQTDMVDAVDAAPADVFSESGSYAFCADHAGVTASGKNVSSGFCESEDAWV